MNPLPPRAAPLVLASIAIVCTLASAAPALAQPARPNTTTAQTFTERREAEGTRIVFTDPDELPGGALDPFANIVKSRPSAARMGLLRPRYDFVPELLKSVEAM